MDAKTIAKNIVPNQWDDFYTAQAGMHGLKSVIDAAQAIEDASSEDITNILTKVRDEENSFSLKDMVWDAIKSTRLAIVLPLEGISATLSNIGAQEEAESFISLHTLLIANVAADNALDPTELTVTCGSYVYKTLIDNLKLIESILSEK